MTEFIDILVVYVSMCGRNSLFLRRPELEERFDASLNIEDYIPRYNIAPQQPHPVISNETPESIDSYQWGLVPHWIDDPKKGFINARSDTAHEKPAFRAAWKSRPCLVLSTGFYEWQKLNGGSKQPYRIYRKDDTAFAMAGLWEEREVDGEPNRTLTILTTEPNEVVESIHNRMPVVLPREHEESWLSEGPDERRELCQPYPGDDLDAYPISTSVNKPSNDSEAIIEPLGNEQSGLGEFT